MAILSRDPQDGLEGSERVCAYCKEPIIFTDIGWLHRLAMGRNCGLVPYPRRAGKSSNYPLEGEVNADS